MLLLWVWLGVALANAELIIFSEAPVVFFVNLVPHPHKGGANQVKVTFGDGKGGEQRVAVRSALGDLLWSGPIDVPEGHRVSIRYSRRQVEVVDDEPVGGRPKKLRSQGIYSVDGEWAYGSPGRPPTGSSGSSSTLPRSEPEPDVFLEAVSEVSQTSGAGGGYDEPTDDIVRPGPDGQGTLRLANRSSSWADVVVDGTVHAFRGERTKELATRTGPHLVEIRDFKQQLLYWGTMWVWPDETVELQFSTTAAPATPERPEAWILRPPPEDVVP